MHVSTFRLYDSTLAALRERLPLILDSQRANLALLVAAAAQAGTLWVKLSSRRPRTRTPIADPPSLQSPTHSSAAR